MSAVPGVSHSRRTVTNIITIAGGHIGSTIVLIATTPYFYGALGASQYGLFIMFNAIVQYASVVDFGLGPGLVKYVAEDHAKGDRRRIREMVTFAYLFYTAVASVIITAMYFGGHFIISRIHMPEELRPEAFPLFMGFVSYFFLSQYYFTLAGLVAGIGRLDISSTIRAVSLLVYIGLAITALQLKLGIFGVLGASYLTLLLTAPTVYVFARRELGPVFCAPATIRWSTIRRLFVTGGWIQLSSIMYLIYAQTDGIVIGFVVNVAAVGLFDLANRLARSIRAMAYYVGSALLPAMSALETQRGIENVQARMVDGGRYIAAVSFAAMGFAVASAPLVFSAWLGSQIQNRSLLVAMLTILCLTAVIENFISMPLTFLRAVGMPKLEAVYSVSTCLGKIALIVALAPRYGIIGVVIGSFFASLIGSIIFLNVFCRARDVRLGASFGKPLIKLLSITGVSTALTALASQLWLRHGLPTRPVAFVELAVNGLVYLVLFLVMVGITKFLHDQDRAFIKRILPARLTPSVDGRLVRFLFAGNQ